MEEGLDKELATIRYGYQQKIDAVKVIHPQKWH